MKIYIFLFLILIFIFLLYQKKYINEYFSLNNLKLPIGNASCFYRNTDKNLINTNNNLNNFENPIILLNSDKNEYPSLTFEKDNINKKQYPYLSFNLNDINNLLKNIKYNKTNNKYLELDNYNSSIYNNKFTEIDNIRLFNSIQSFEKVLVNLYKKEIKNNLDKYHCASLYICFPSIISRKLIKIEKSINSNDLRYTFASEIFVNNKTYSHIYKVVLESIGINNLINSVELIGNRTSDSIFSSLPYDKSDKYINIYSQINNYPYNASNTYLRNSDETNIIFNDKTIKKILKKKFSDNLYYKCYGKDAVNINDCEIGITTNNYKTIKGKWDKLCKIDNECPYFKKNKNYENNRGGCINGWCEMPKGIKQISPHFIDKKSKPMCYNCKTSSKYNCCKEQKNKNIYKNISSPDYIFKNDIYERTNNIDTLKKKNLNIN